jgi:glycosyltransferase involved in cell wall biosynthesis
VDGFLDRCWKSLYYQSIGIDELECIFVNDGSIDDSRTIDKLHDIEKDSPENVIIIDMDHNMGQGEARNIGIQYATGKYLMFLDADDEFRLDACERVYNLAEENGADIVQFNHLYILENETRSSNASTETRLYQIDSREDRVPFLIDAKVTFGCTNKLYNLELVREIGVQFPAGVKYEEPLFVYPLFLYADRIMLIKEDLYLYHFNENSTVTSMLGKRILDHPNVQLRLLDFVMNLDRYEEYRDIIEIYFLWTFYLETISFASRERDCVIPLDFFGYMQEMCQKLCPYWEENPYLHLVPAGARKALKSIHELFHTQNELNEFVLSAGKQF